MVVFVCEDSPEGIFTGVYDAWSSRLGHENVRLEVQGEYNYSLFSEYREVAVDQLKAQKVVRSVRRSLSELAYSWIYRTALSERDDRAEDCISLSVRFQDIAVSHSVQQPESHPCASLRPDI